MNLKDKFTFKYGDIEIEVEKTNDLHYAKFTAKGEKVPRITPLRFDTLLIEDVMHIQIIKREDSRILATVKASDITKPEPSEQKTINFDPLEDIKKRLKTILQDLEKLK